MSESNYTKGVWLWRQSENKILIKQNVTIEDRCKTIAFELNDKDEFRVADTNQTEVEDDRLVNKDTRDVQGEFPIILDQYSERYTGREEQVEKVQVVRNSCMYTTRRYQSCHRTEL